MIARWHVSLSGRSRSGSFWSMKSSLPPLFPTSLLPVAANRSIISLFVVIVTIITSSCAVSAEEMNNSVERTCRITVWPPYLLRGEKIPFASFDGNVLCIIGDITRNEANEAIRILKENDIRNIYIWSGGGDSAAALDIADQIRTMDIDIYVWQLCASSCANYLFLAASRKHVLPESVVAWHAVPHADPSDPAVFQQLDRRHREFFEGLGLDDALAGRLPCHWNENRQFRMAVMKGKRPAWTYSKRELEEHFHVQGIEEMWWPKSQHALSLMLRKSKMPPVYIFHTCS
jgi:hypothetical protein